MKEVAVQAAGDVASQLEAIAADLRRAAKSEGELKQVATSGAELRLGDVSPLRQGWYDRLTWAKATYKARQVRNQFIDPDLFGEPAWDILLDLYAAHFERRHVNVSSGCIASGVPPTTALRHIAILETRGLIERVRPGGDGRICYIELTPAGVEKMDGMFLKLRAAADTFP